MKIDRALISASWRSWYSSDAERVGPYALHWLWTVLVCAAIAVGFTIVGFIAFARDSEGAWRNLPGWGIWYGKNFVISLTIGALTHISFDVLRAMMGGPAAISRLKGWRRTAFFSGVPLVCVVFGWPLGVSLAGGDLTRLLTGPQGQNLIAGAVLASLVLTFAFHQYFSIRASQHRAERDAAEAQLRLLQGQMEPHFLFNTLANVISLIDHDAPRAKLMLESFTGYLRCSLASLRVEDATLGSEIDLAQNYLELLKTRMEDRLAFGIAADESARHARLPPLLLQPLVENAIHHGLEPKIEGGRVQVSARVQGSELVLEVSDDGLGLAAPARHRGGTGVALANMRERLKARYGGGASLTLEDGRPGTVATLRLPFETARLAVADKT